jgi:hypothetical protein
MNHKELELRIWALIIKQNPISKEMLKECACHLYPIHDKRTIQFKQMLNEFRSLEDEIKEIKVQEWENAFQSR